MKKLAIAAMALFASVASLSVQAKTWHKAEVNLAGAGFRGEIFVRLTSLNNETYKFTNRMFKISDVHGNTGLAIMMAAATSNRQVLVESNVDELDESAVPTIFGIYLTKDIVSK